jgi:acyl carrier protein
VYRLAIVQNILSDLTGIATIADEDMDRDLFGPGGGLNSIMVVQLIVRLEAEFELEVLDEELDVRRFRSCRRILEFLAEKLGAEEGVKLPLPGTEG